MIFNMRFSVKFGIWTIIVCFVTVNLKQPFYGKDLATVAGRIKSRDSTNGSSSPDPFLPSIWSDEISFFFLLEILSDDVLLFKGELWPSWRICFVSRWCINCFSVEICFPTHSLVGYAFAVELRKIKLVFFLFPLTTSCTKREFSLQKSVPLLAFSVKARLSFNNVFV